MASIAQARIQPMAKGGREEYEVINHDIKDKEQGHYYHVLQYKTYLSR